MTGWRVMTWNLLGSHDPDLGGIAAVIREHEPDVVALQEVRRTQARGLARHQVVNAVAQRWEVLRFKQQTAIRGHLVRNDRPVRTADVEGAFWQGHYRCDHSGAPPRQGVPDDDWRTFAAGVNAVG
jgi:endonuclease/exonuclease/phosphatase family metal-dependent hydrolase